MQYRPEIDGLRAIAVVSVILFHLNMPLLITTAILGTSDIAPNKQTLNTATKIFNVIQF